MLGGELRQADPASEAPVVAILLDATGVLKTGAGDPATSDAAADLSAHIEVLSGPTVRLRD